MKKPSLKDLSTEINNVVRTLGTTAIGKAVDDEAQPKPPAPAWYEYRRDEFYVHVDQVDRMLVAAGHKIDGMDVILTPKSGPRSKSSLHTIYRGLLIHEVGHSLASQWMRDIPVKKRMRGLTITHGEMDVMTMLEELRVEQFMVNSNAGNRSYLRRSVPLALGDPRADPPATAYAAASLWALGYGRFLAGVVDEDEVVWIDDALRSILGDNEVDWLLDLLEEALTVSRRDPLDRMLEIAREWISIVGEPPASSVSVCHTAGDMSDSSSGESGEDGEGEGEGDEEGDGDDEYKEETPSGEFTPDAPDSTDRGAGAKDTKKLTAEQSELIKKALETAGTEIAADWERVITDVMLNPDTEAARAIAKKWSHEEHPPTAQDRRGVIQAAKALENLVVPSISKVPTPRVLPPGRLRTRDAVRASAERAMGRMVTARPWTGTKRAHVVTRPIVVGIATDVSGSMRWAEKGVAQFAYTWANAGVRIGARSAAATFGDRVDLVVAPGEILTKVRRRPANGMSEDCDRALAVLDGLLKLSIPNGAAKFLVIVSDGDLVAHNECAKVKRRLETLKVGGTIVLWVTPRVNSFLKDLSSRNLTNVVKVEETDVYRYGYEDGSDESKTFELIQTAVISAITRMR